MGPRSCGNTELWEHRAVGTWICGVIQLREHRAVGTGSRGNIELELGDHGAVRT